MAKKVLTQIKLQAVGGQASPAPPVGPALGQHGVNIVEFTKSYNEKTADKSGQVIPVKFKGQGGGYSHAMFLNDGPPIYGGRELWGFPKKRATPKIEVESDVLVGTLHYGSVLCASGTMGYKHRPVDHDTVMHTLNAPNFILKIIPHVDGSPRICELVRYCLEDITLKEAWTGPAALGLFPHALADVARLPVREVVSALHFKADLTLGATGQTAVGTVRLVEPTINTTTRFGAACRTRRGPRWPCGCG